MSQAFPRVPIPPQLQPALGRAVHQLRKDGKTTQEELAHAAELPVGTVGRIERGRSDPKYSTLKRLATGLGVTVAELVALAADYEQR